MTHFCTVCSGVSFYTTYIPDYRPDRFIKVPPGKFIMILLIELYLEWLVLTLPLDTAAFVLIRNTCPNPSDLNEYETPPDSGCQLNGAVVNVPGRIKKLEDIVCQDLTFSFFVDGVLSGRINTDGLPKFSQHMATSYEAMEEAYHKLEERHQDNPSYSLPAYKPPPKPKAKSSGSKTKVKPGFSFFEKQLKNAYTFPGSDEEVEDDDNNTSGDYEKKDLAKTFLELLEQNAIVSVKFRQSTLRDLYAADSTPKSGIGTSLLTAVDNFLSVKKLAQKETAKERREAAKKRSAESVEEEESSQDASQETSPVRQSPRIKRKKTSQEADQEDSSETKADDDQDPDDDNQSSSDKSEGGDVENPDEDDDNQ